MKDAAEPKPTLEENDGEFWMCYKDFLRLSRQPSGGEAARHALTLVIPHAIQVHA